MKNFGCFLILVLVLNSPVFAAGQYLISFTTGTDVGIAVLQENGSKLTVVNKTSSPAAGPVGATAILPGGHGGIFNREEMYAFYTFGDKTNRPKLARFSTTYHLNDFSNHKHELYPAYLASYTNMGITATESKWNIFRTKQAPKQDAFFFPGSSSGRPLANGVKFLDNPVNSVLRSTCVSRDNRYFATSLQSGNSNVLSFGELNDNRVENKFDYQTVRAFITTGISGLIQKAPLMITRELGASGNNFQTSVHVRSMDPDSGRPGPARKLAGPNLVAAGSYEYANIFYDTVEISNDGGYTFYTAPAPGCGAAWQLFGRKILPSGNFGGPAFPVFGKCNVQLGNDGKPRAVRALDVVKYE